jgi:hypothetical protein
MPNDLISHWPAPPLAVSEEELEERLALVGRFGPRPAMVAWVEDLLCVKIPLTQGKFALIDRDDYEDIGRFAWHAYQNRNTFYARRGWVVGGNLVMIRMHNQIMGVKDAESPVDHASRNGLDNRRRNLRISTRGRNKHNSCPSSSTGFKGVYVTRYGTFMSQARVNGESHYFGTFDTAEQAALAYDSGVREFYGEAASLNFPFDS